MEFEAIGSFHGEPARVTWRDGEIVESEPSIVGDEIAILVEAADPGQHSLTLRQRVRSMSSCSTLTPDDSATHRLLSQPGGFEGLRSRIHEVLARAGGPALLRAETARRLASGGLQVQASPTTARQLPSCVVPRVPF